MHEELKLLGLNDSEIKVYLSLLELGEALASEIANKSEIPRASIYDILERLQQEGLVSYITKDFKRYFSASEPKTIIENLDYTKKRIKDILPNLEALKKNNQPMSKTEIFEGKNGLQMIMNLMLEEKNLFVLGASRKSSEILPFFVDKWHKERIKRKIKTEIIYNDIEGIRSSVSKSVKILGSKKFWSYRFLHTNYLSPVMTIVFGNKVALVNWVKNPSVILIENRDIAETYKQYFLRLWELAKK
ncbi:MAG: helix-turn-helix domain-containing protein [Nanoarchaeota archaeon]|nr:helix-turn-helix domain-containing protein [Nanoarchaeota archaeon]